MSGDNSSNPQNQRYPYQSPDKHVQIQRPVPFLSSLLFAPLLGLCPGEHKRGLPGVVTGCYRYLAVLRAYIYVRCTFWLICRYFMVSIADHSRFIIVTMPK